jgi:hephaestin
VRTLLRVGLALALSAAALLSAAGPAAAKVRTYFIAADEVLWNYAPSGRDLIAGTALPKPLPGQLGYIYHKLMYRSYTDATFTRQIPRVEADRYLGSVGPVLRAEVGDTIVVVFKNNARLPLGMLPSGGLVEPRPRLIPPGFVHTYRWYVPETAGPGPGDESSTMWTYDSGGKDYHAALMAGLEGPIVVTRAGAARADGSPSDVDHEVFAAFREMDESASALFTENLTDPLTNPRKVTRAAALVPFTDLSVSINGFTFGNMPMLTLRRGERVRWYVFDSNNDGDFHAPTWSGQTVLVGGRRMDTVTLNPGTRAVADMVPDNPGVWLLYCTLNIHLESGMKARYQVTR